MNLKKLTSLLLVFVMVLSTMVLFAGCVEKADEEWALDPDQYDPEKNPTFPIKTDIIHHRENGASTMDYYMVEENSNYELYINTSRLDIALIHKATGQVWYSNPTDDIINSSGGKENEMKSQIQISFLDKTSEANSIWNSYKQCTIGYEQALKEGSQLPYFLTYTRKEDGEHLRVKYIIGETRVEYAIPTVISKEVYDELHEMLVNDKEFRDEFSISRFTLESNYTEINNKILYDKTTPTTRERYFKVAPGLRTLTDDQTVYYMKTDTIWGNKLLATTIQGMFAGWYERTQLADYSAKETELKELLKNWDTEFSVAARKVNLFCIPLDYILQEDGLKVQIKQEDVVFNDSRYEITYLDLLKYFGCGTTEENGYMISPDGSGALVNFNNGRFSIPSELKVQVYGIDRGKNYSTQPAFAQQGYLPVWGIKKDASSLFAIIEEGADAANIITDIPRTKKNSVNYTYSSYRFIEFDDMSLFGASSKLRTYQSERYTGDVSIKYAVLGGDVEYSDMAEYYRNYLIAKNAIPDSKVDENINFNLELAGAMGDTTAFMGVRYDFLNALTTFEEAEEILQKLLDGGVKNINLRYNGAANNGLANQAYDSIRPLLELGGTAGFNKLKKFADDNGIELYMEADIARVYTDKLFDNYMKLLDTSRMISRSNGIYTQYNIMQPDNYMKQAFIVRPQKVQSLADSLLKDLQNKGLDTVSLGSLSWMLTGDYHLGSVYDRSEVKEIYAEIYNKFRDAGISVLSAGANDYALSATDVLFELPNSSSEFYMADETIPFYQMVIHGIIEYSGEYINQTGEKNRSILKAVEFGAGMTYRWMSAKNEDIRNIYFENIYSINYESWIEEAINQYVRYNNELGHTATLKMTGHDCLTSTLTLTEYEDGTRVYVNYDDNDVDVEGVGVVSAENYLVVRGDK